MPYYAIINHDGPLNKAFLLGLISGEGGGISEGGPFRFQWFHHRIISENLKRLQKK